MRTTSLLVIVLAVVGAPIHSQTAGDPSTRSRDLARPRDRVWFDAPGDGAIWVRGADYKASFSKGGATFIPFLGSEAPRNFPVTFAIEEVRRGSESVTPLVAEPGRDGERVVFDRDGFREIYEVRPGTVEQLFEIDRSTGTGDLVLVVRVVTDLPGTSFANGLRFANQLGGVQYGAATAVDAAGASVEVPGDFRDGHIVLTVPAAFVDHARFPLTIDPLITTTSASQGTGLVNVSSDVAFDFLSDSYLVVFEEAFSAADHDVGAVALNSSGGQIAGGFGYIDYTSDFWAAPRVANSQTNYSFMVVAERHVGATSDIWARSRSAFLPVSMSTQFVVSSVAGSSSTKPDVGGSHDTEGLLYPFCFCWQRTSTSGVTSIWSKFYGNGFWSPDTLNGIGTDESNPSMVKSGTFGHLPNGAPVTTWRIVYQWVNGPSNHDIILNDAVWYDTYGAMGGFGSDLDNTGSDDTNPSISSETDNGFTLVAFERHAGVMTYIAGMTLFHGITWTPSQSLSALVGASSTVSQYAPCTDSDGIRFVLGYSEDPGANSKPFLATLHKPSPGSLAVSEPAVLLTGNSGLDERLQVTSRRSGGGAMTQYLACFDSTSPFTLQSTIKCALYDGRSNAAPGPANWFNYVTPGCGGLSLSTSGRPALGEAITCALTGVTGTPVIAISPPTSILPVCPACALILDLANLTIFPAASVTAVVPPNGALVNVQIALQGADIGSTGGCGGGLSFRLSQGVIVTIL